MSRVGGPADWVDNQTLRPLLSVAEEPNLDGWWIATAGKLGGIRLPREALLDLTLRLRNGTFRFGTDKGER